MCLPLNLILHSGFFSASSQGFLSEIHLILLGSHGWSLGSSWLGGGVGEEKTAVDTDLSTLLFTVCLLPLASEFEMQHCLVHRGT